MRKNTNISPPGPGVASQPHLHELPSEAFEYFSLEVACKQYDGIEQADLFEKRGVAQYGADFYIDRGSKGQIIGSCKAHENPGKRVIVDEAAGDFIKHWETYWKNQNVKKFIICLAADARTLVRRRNIEKAKKNVRALGIECEVWTKRNFIDLLRPHPHIVRRYLGFHWVNELCELQLQYPGDTGAAILSNAMLRNEAQQAAQSPLLQAKLEELQDLLHRGFFHEAAEEAKKLRDEAIWATAEPEHKARILRTIAAPLVYEDVEKAASLYTEAAEIHPPSDRYYKAVITAHSEGRIAAINLLDDPRTARERAVKAAFLIEEHQPEEANNLIGDIPADSDERAELARLKSIALIALGRAEEAIAAATEALDALPSARGGRLVYAAAHFSSSLSPSTGSLGIAWPSPYPSVLIKSDAISLARRQKALHLYEELIRDAPTTLAHAQANVWRLASIIDNSEKREEATRLINDSHSEGVFHPGLVMWALARRLEFDRRKARRALLKGADVNDAEAITALLMLHIDDRKLKQARELLDQRREALSQISEKAAEIWEQELDTHQSRRKKRKSNSLSVVGPSSDAESLEKVLKDESAPPYIRFESASQLAELNAWGPVWAFSTFLMHDIATGEALRLCAYAAANTREPTEVLSLLDENVEKFFAGTPPSDLQTLKVEMLAAAGKTATALLEAQRTYTDPAEPSFITRAQIEAQAGDLTAASRTISLAATADNVALNDPKVLIHWSNILKRENPETSKELLTRAQDIGLKGFAGQAMTLALELMPDEARAFSDALSAEASRSPKAPIRVLTMDETLEIWRQDMQRQAEHAEIYENGDSLSHVIFGDAMGLAFLGPIIAPDKRSRPDPHIAHAIGSAPRTLSFSKVVIDVTAMLVAEALELWPALLASSLELILPADWSAALLAMEQRAATSQPDRKKAKSDVIAAVNSGELRVIEAQADDVHSIIFDEDEANEQSWPISQVKAHFENSTNAHADLFEKISSKPILIEAGVAVEMASAGHLQRLCGSADVMVEKPNFEIIKQEFENEELGDAVAERLKQLRNRLSTSVISGRVSVAPALRPEDRKAGDPNSAVEASFWSVIHHPAAEGVVAWVDDRYINGHSTINETPIIAVQSILSRLLEDGNIDAGGKADALRRLRHAHFVYLLPSVEEAAEVLKLAITDPQEAQDRLDAIQKAFSRFQCLQKLVLEKTDGAAIVEHKAAFDQYLMASRVVGHILADTSIPIDDAIDLVLIACRAFRADWRDGAEEKNGTKIVHDLFVSWHASIVSACLELQLLLDESGRERVQKILDAIYNAVTLPATEASPQLLPDIHKAVAHAASLGLKEDESTDADQRRLAKLLIGRFIDAMPNELRDGIFEERDLREEYDAQQGVTIGDKFFETDNFWGAVDALSEGNESARVTSVDGKEYTLSLKPEGVLLSHDIEDPTLLTFTVSDAFDPDKSRREAGVKNFLESAGFPEIEGEQALKRFNDARSAEERETVISALVENTVEGKLFPLSRLQSGARVSITDLSPPSANALSNWLGFTKEIGSPDDAFAACAAAHGYRIACLRWMGIPRPFPPCARQWLSDSDKSEALATISLLADAAATPPSLRNVLDLARARQDLSASVDDLKKRLIDIGAFSYRTNIHLARGTLQSLLGMHSDAQPDAALMCGAWAWAHHLQKTMGKAGASTLKLAEWFATESKAGRGGFVRLIRFSDLLSPNQVRVEQLIAGTMNALSSDEILSQNDDQKLSLRSVLSIETSGSTPSISLLPSRLALNAHGSWISDPSDWLVELFGIEDPFIRGAILEPDKVGMDALSSADPDLAIFICVGVDHFSEADANKLVAHVDRRVTHANSQALSIIASLLGRLPIRSDEQREKRNELFRKIAQRRIESEELGIDNPKTALLLIEPAISAIIRDGGAWWEAAENILRDFARAWAPKYAANLAELILVVAEATPVAHRSPLLRLHAEVIAAS